MMKITHNTKNNYNISIKNKRLILQTFFFKKHLTTLQLPKDNYNINIDYTSHAAFPINLFNDTVFIDLTGVIFLKKIKRNNRDITNNIYDSMIKSALIDIKPKNCKFNKTFNKITNLLENKGINIIQFCTLNLIPYKYMIIAINDISKSRFNHIAICVSLLLNNFLKIDITNGNVYKYCSKDLVANN